MRVYIAGPMRGYFDNNFPAFDMAAGWFRSYGHDVMNPADIDRQQNLTGAAGITPAVCRAHLLRDMAALMLSDGIALLDNWEHSVGGLTEACGARWMSLAFYRVRAITRGPRVRDIEVRKLSGPPRLKIEVAYEYETEIAAAEGAPQGV